MNKCNDTNWTKTSEWRLCKFSLSWRMKTLFAIRVFLGVCSFQECFAELWGETDLAAILLLKYFFIDGTFYFFLILLISLILVEVFLSSKDKLKLCFCHFFFSPKFIINVLITSLFLMVNFASNVVYGFSDIFFWQILPFKQIKL